MKKLLFIFLLFLSPSVSSAVEETPECATPQTSEMCSACIMAARYTFYYQASTYDACVDQVNKRLLGLYLLGVTDGLLYNHYPSFPGFCADDPTPIRDMHVSDLTACYGIYRQYVQILGVFEQYIEACQVFHSQLVEAVDASGFKPFIEIVLERLGIGLNKEPYCSSRTIY